MSIRLCWKNAVFAGLGTATGALSAAQFALATDVLTATVRVIYDTATGALLYDRDGSGSAVAVQFASAFAGASASNSAVGVSALDFLII